MEVKDRITGEILNITEKNFYKIKREYELNSSTSIYTSFELNDEFLDRFHNYIRNDVDWNLISAYQILSKESIRKYCDSLNINDVIMNQKLDSELLNFLIKKKIKINWTSLSIYQTLDEDFIEQWKFKFPWGEISMYQKLCLNSEFIKKYKNLLVPEDVEENIALVEGKEKEKFINYMTNSKRSRLMNQILINEDIDYFLTYVGGNNLRKTIKGDYYILNNLVKKLEIGKEIESETNNRFCFPENICLNRWYTSLFHKDYYLAKIYYKDLFNLFQANKITPIAKFSKGWKLKIE